MILHKSGLSEEQKAVCLARAQGSLKKDDIAKAMRSCFPEFVITKKKPHGLSLVENEIYAVESEEEISAAKEFEDVELLLAEFEKTDANDPVDEMFEEADVAEVMAVSWKEKRQELNKLQKSRRFKAATDLRRSFRELKKRTKCHRCHRVGHWSRECPQKAQSSRPSSSTGSTGAQFPKKSPEMGAAMVLHSSSSFCNSGYKDSVADVSLLERMRRHVHRVQEQHTSEQLLVSSPGYGVLDSGCGRTIIGSQTLMDFQQMWKDRNMTVPKPFAETNHFRFGNGQHEMSTESIVMPIILGGKDGSIKAAIIQGTAPLLISRSALKTFKASLHFGSDELELFESGKSIPLQTNSANQYIVNVLDDASDGSKFEEVMMTSASDGSTVAPAEDHGDLTESKSNVSKVLLDSSESSPNPKNSSETDDVLTPSTATCRKSEHAESSFKPSKKQARKLRKQFKQCCAIQTSGNIPGKKWFVVEVFSPPRFAKVVEPLGLKAWSIDLDTGYDLRDPKVRTSIKTELAQHPPELLVLCPPCTNEGGWSNYNSMFLSPAEVLRKRNESRLYIKFCCELYRQQVDAGGRALFEHPAGARTWIYPEMLHLMQKHTVVNLHMCRYNLKLPQSDKLIRKSTRLVASHPEFQKLTKKCPGDSSPEHRCHQVIEGSWPGVGQVSKFCAKYTPEFVKAVLECIPSFPSPQEVLVIDEVPVEHRHLIGAVSRENSSEPSDSQVDATLDKLHRNLGHPPNHDLVRILKHGMASEKAISRARNFSCPFCQSQKQPKVPLPAQANRVFDFNDQVGIDVKHLPGWQPNQKIRALNIVDQASCYQRMIPFFETETAQVVRDLYAENWVVWAGPPKELIVDPSHSNLGENMVSPTELEGTVIRQIAAEAHWQLGRTERHGGYFEKILSRLIEQFSPSSKTEWLECVRHAHVKNQMIQSYGYTPHQYVFGKSPHIPGDLLNEPLHVVPGTASLEVPATDRAHALRTAARKAVLELQDDRSLRKALAARPRVVQPFKAGDHVAYWRQQKWIAGQLHQGGRWYGTAIVIGYVGRNLVLAHRKQILRCAPEQVRYATTEERTLLETHNSDLLGIKDMIEGGAFKSNQFIDLTPGSYPTQSESFRSDTPVVPEPPALREVSRANEGDSQPQPNQPMEVEPNTAQLEVVPPEPIPAETPAEPEPPMPAAPASSSQEEASS